MAAATDGALPKDIYGNPSSSVYVPNLGTVAQQGGMQGTDTGGEPYALAYENISALGGTAIATPADSTAFAGTMPSVRMEQSGTGVASPVRVPNVFKTFAAQAITAGTPLVVWTPATGKKFRLQGFSLSVSAACYPIIKDGGTTAVLNGPLLAIAGVYTTPGMGNGILSTTANNALNLDVSANATVTGFVFGIEE